MPNPGEVGGPFSETEKAQIRFYLGYQDLFRDLNTRLESSFGLNAMSQPAIELVRGILADLAAIDAGLVSARRRFKASRVGSVTLNAEERDMLCAEGRRLVGRLVSIFGTEPLRDVFESIGGHGGLIPLG